MADTDWEAYRPEIVRLYIHESNTLTQVMNYMESKYSFTASKAQYQKHFREWGLQKYQKAPRQGDWKFIGRRVEKRKNIDGKESEVYINGVRYPPEKLRKTTYGKAFVSTIDRVGGAPSPNTPEGIVVCTPASPGICSVSNPSLPWLRFRKLLQPALDQDQPSPSSTLTVSSPREAGTLSHNVNRDTIERLISIVPWAKLSHPPNIHSSSRISAALRILMPEPEEQDEHGRLVTKLCNSRQKSMDFLHLELFLLSNKLTSHGLRGKSEESMETHDARVIEMFRSSGWNNIKRLELLLSAEEVTAAAIAEEVFASALRLLDEDIVEMMLKAGMNPNGPIDTVHHGALTPLQFTSSIAIDESRYLTELLLLHGADVNLSHNGNSALYYALQVKDRVQIDILLGNGAIVSPSCLAAAAETIKDANLFGILLDACSDVNARSGLQDDSILAQAILHGNKTAAGLLLGKGADVNALSVIDFDKDWGTTTVLGLAIRKKRSDLIELTLQACTEINPSTHDLPYVSPLALAVETNNAEITEQLIHKGINVQVADGSGKMTLVERAVKSGNLQLCKLLMEHQARVDRPLSEGQQTSSALLTALKKNAISIVEVLINGGARLNDVYPKAPGTVLAAAIETGNRTLIHILRDAGATVVGQKLQRIGKLETALYLQEIGTLQNILRICGARTLAAALLAGDHQFAQWLLNHDVDIESRATHIDDSSSSMTPLEAAIRKKNFVFATAILDRGARVTDDDLAAAVDSTLNNSDNIDFLRRLLDGFLGSAPIALGSAILYKRPDLVQLILGSGANPMGAPDPDIWDLDEFHHHVWFSLDDSKSVLEMAVLVADGSTLQTLLHLAPWDRELTSRALTLAILLGHDKLAADLLKTDVDVNHEMPIHPPRWKNEDGEEVSGETHIAPLQAAVKNQLVSVALILAKRSDTDINYLGKGPRRRTALQHAVENGNMELVNELLNRGADINGKPAMDGGATALQIAAIQGYLGIARKLIDMGADINAAPARFNGRTALEGAAEHGRIDMLQMLHDHGAVILGKKGRRQYQRAVRFAEKNGHGAAARLLRSFKLQAESGSP